MIMIFEIFRMLNKVKISGLLKNFFLMIIKMKIKSQVRENGMKFLTP